MIVGLSVAAFTLVHVIITLIAIASGFIGVATQMVEATFDNVVVTQP